VSQIGGLEILIFVFFEVGLILVFCVLGGFENSAEKFDFVYSLGKLIRAIYEVLKSLNFNDRLLEKIML
jgi:hypothetical protein